MLRRPQLNVGWVAALPLAFLAGCNSDAPDGQVPTFEVNPFWPQPIEYPNIFGAVSGVTIAPDGNILIAGRVAPSGRPTLLPDRDDQRRGKHP